MSDETILKLAQDRFALAALAERDIRKEALLDLKFLSGEQWDPQEKKAREDNGRPALVINRLPQFVDQVVNEQRRNRPGASVSPVGGGADADTADVCEGLIRTSSTPRTPTSPTTPRSSTPRRVHSAIGSTGLPIQMKSRSTRTLKSRR